MTIEVAQKITDGDLLTDAELIEAVNFYCDVYDYLAVMGERFYIARVECGRIRDSLILMSKARGIPGW